MRRRLGEPFVYVGNKIAGRDRDMESVIDLRFNEDSDDFLFEVSLTMRRYDVHVGTYDTYEEAGKVSDNIERNMRQLA